MCDCECNCEGREAYWEAEWQELNRWMEQNFPPQLGPFPPATNTDLLGFLELMGRTKPADYTQYL